MPRISFRDGDRDVPDHVAELLSSIETYRLTYEQSMAAANNRLIANEVDRRVTDILRDHFRQLQKR